MEFPPAQARHPPRHLPTGGTSVQMVQGVELPWLQLIVSLFLLYFF